MTIREPYEQEIYERWMTEGASALTPDEHRIALYIFLSDGQTPSGQRVMVCNSCQDVLPDNARFCVSCGAAIINPSYTEQTVRLPAVNEHTPAIGATVRL